MALSPIAFIAPNYDEHPSWWLKFYNQGTTTPLQMATDSTGATLLAKAELDSNGFINTAGDAIFIPWVDGFYDAYLFPTAAEADANNTTNAIRIADNISSAVAGGGGGGGGGSVTVTTQTVNINYRLLNTHLIEPNTDFQTYYDNNQPNLDLGSIINQTLGLETIPIEAMDFAQGNSIIDLGVLV